MDPEMIPFIEAWITTLMQYYFTVHFYFELNPLRWPIIPRFKFYKGYTLEMRWLAIGVNFYFGNEGQYLAYGEDCSIPFDEVECEDLHVPSAKAPAIRLPSEDKSNTSARP